MDIATQIHALEKALDEIRVALDDMSPTPRVRDYQAAAASYSRMVDTWLVSNPSDAQRDAMVRWTDAQRAAPRLKLRLVDVAGSDAKLLLELKRAAAAGDTDAFVIGVPAAVDDALVAAIALVKRPVLFTLPIAAPSGDGAKPVIV